MIANVHSNRRAAHTRRPLRGIAVLLCIAASVFTLCLTNSLLFLPAPLPDSRVLETSVTAASTGDVDHQSPTLRANLRPHAVLGTSFAGTEAKSTWDPLSLSVASAGASTAMTALAALAASDGQMEVVKSSPLDKISILLQIGVWYFLNIAFNIYNKKALQYFPFPWTVALFQMFFGILLFGPLWATGIRKAPKLYHKDILTLMPAALGHVITHGGAAVSFTAGAVSFTQIVKASEPVASAVLNYLFAGEVLALPVYAALIPIIGGVGLASVSELSFTWLSFNAAMISNLASAGRAVYSKTVMGKEIGENMTPANFYAVMTILATLLLLPIAYFMEGPAAIIKGFALAYARGGTEWLWHFLYSGFFYYVYNEVAFLALSKLDPVSHAVANTMKRVGIIITAVIVFSTPLTTLGVIGSSIGILGTLLYSLAKSAYA